MTIQSNMTKMLLAAFVIASPSIGQASNSDSSTDSLNNLGLYIGFDLTATPTAVPSATTPDLTTTINTQFGAAVSYVAAFPYMTGPANFITYVPSSLSSYTTPYDVLTNIPTTSYSVWKNMSNVGSINGSSTTTYASAVAGIDQTNSITSTGYFADITSQALFDLLTTPDYTYCTQDNTDDTAIYIDSQCTLLQGMSPVPYHNYEVTNAALNGGSYINSSNSDYIFYGANGSYGGTSSEAPQIPSPTEYFSASYNEPLIPQLSATSLIGPLQYNTTAQNIDQEIPDGTTGYPATTQETQALAFIKYLSGMTQLNSLPSYSDYNTTYQNIINTSGTVSATTQNAALGAFYGYFMGLRNYAATVSVGLSNLSTMMGNRMPNGITNTSKEFDDFTMATRRVLNPASGSSSSTPSNEWVNDMQTAAPITMQREMLYLLAEINYQLYLARKQDERILLTLSAMELQYSASARSGLNQLQQVNATTSSTTS